MQPSPKDIRERLKRYGDVRSDGRPVARVSVQREAELRADEDDPARTAPSAEGVTTFPGLPGKVRAWLARELSDIGRDSADRQSGKR